MVEDASFGTGVGAREGATSLGATRGVASHGAAITGRGLRRVGGGGRATGAAGTRDPSLVGAGIQDHKKELSRRAEFDSDDVVTNVEGLPRSYWGGGNALFPERRVEAEQVLYPERILGGHVDDGGVPGVGEILERGAVAVDGNDDDSGVVTLRGA